MYATENSMKLFENGYENLAAAIILQAAKDYRKALAFDERSVKRECERFFRSEWFTVLTDADGETLIRKLREEVKGL